MISLSADITRLQKVLGSFAAMEKDLKVAINKTTTRTKSQMAKQVVQTVAVTQKAVKSEIEATKAKSEPSATVTLRKSSRLGLRHFGAKQTAKGVRYKISKGRGKQSQGFAEGAFQGPRPGVMKVSWKGNAFKRVGKARKPILMIRGPSPWGVFVKNDYEPPTVKDTREYLRKQVRERIRFRILKAQGKI